MHQFSQWLTGHVSNHSQEVRFFKDGLGKQVDKEFILVYRKVCSGKYFELLGVVPAMPLK